MPSARAAAALAACRLVEQPSPAAWRLGLPPLRSAAVLLRELVPGDARALAAMVTRPELGEFLALGPTTEPELREFIAWTYRARQAGRYLTYGVVPAGSQAVAGIFQLWPLERHFETMEWGFALAVEHWGTGLFREAATLLIEFALGTLGVNRLEARAAADNHQGAAALRRLGALPEGTLRKCFRIRGAYRDHVMWAILADTWGRRLPAQAPPRRR